MARLRIAQLANFVSETSGGMKIAIDELGRGYLASGADRMLIIPGPRDCITDTEMGTIVQVREPKVSSTYRMIAEPHRVFDMLGRFSPTSVECSDKWTLSPAGRWASRNNVGSVLFSHEQLSDMLSMWARRSFGVETAVGADQRPGRTAPGAGELRRTGGDRLEFPDRRLVAAIDLVLGRQVVMQVVARQVAGDARQHRRRDVLHFAARFRRRLGAARQRQAIDLPDIAVDEGAGVVDLRLHPRDIDDAGRDVLQIGELHQLQLPEAGNQIGGGGVVHSGEGPRAAGIVAAMNCARPPSARRVQRADAVKEVA